MLSKNLSTTCNIIDHISLYHFWANTLPSVLPIVADGSHLSICYLKKVVPELLKVVLYQLSAKIQQNPSLTPQNLAQVTDEYDFVLELLVTLVTKKFIENGSNFVTLKQLSKNSPSIFEQWFDDETQKTMIAGVLLEKTHLPLDNLLTIWQTITALAVINLADIISSLQNTIDSAQITEWLAMQPVFFMSPEDTGLINAVNFKRAVSFQAMQQQQLKWSQIQNIADLPVYQQHIVQQMTIYKASNFFNIAPIAIPHAHFDQHVISKGIRQINKAVRSNTQTAPSASNIFAKPQVRKPARWIDKLQNHWIATATVFSVAVFGGVGALVSVKDKPAVTQPSAKMSVANPVYRDVAIVKVASTPSTVTNEMTTAEHHKKHDKSKSLDEKPSVQSEKARAMKKSDKQEESKKAESKKDRKKNTNDDTKADGKNEAKQDQKKKASSSKVDSQQSEKTSSTTKKSKAKDKAVKEKSPKEKDKSPSSKTAPDKKSVKKPDDKANNKTDKKPSNKSKIH
ncbi:hypothetical protein [Moraxella sp. CTOTU49803]|uniref:hypothetical protein n=1 Tax=Moraxella sp. CTOTU49803 TaxID=2953840 RepID=UPI0028A8E59C|nr:hypothetical protein [Moraxella sp. CTOTU49803]